MTKEEIIKNIMLRRGALHVINEHRFYSEASVINCLQEAFGLLPQPYYADQQTSELKAELFKATETAKITSVTQRQHIERLQNELNELKEKHKSDVINAIASCLYEAGDDDLEQEFHYKKAEKYYKQKFE